MSNSLPFLSKFETKTIRENVNRVCKHTNINAIRSEWEKNSLFLIGKFLDILTTLNTILFSTIRILAKKKLGTKKANVIMNNFVVAYSKMFGYIHDVSTSFKVDF